MAGEARGADSEKHVLRFHRPARREEMYKPPREVSALGLTLDDEASFRPLLGL